MKNYLESMKGGLKSKAVLALLIVLISGQSGLFGQTPTLASATSLIDKGQPEKALKEIATLLASDPRNEKIYYQQGRAYFDLENYVSAQTSFSRGADLGARYPWNFIGLGAVAATDNNFQVAKTNLDKAGSLNTSNDVSILLGIAEAYLNSNKKEFLSEAEIILTKVTIADAKNVKAYILLGLLYDRKNINELAQYNYEKALELDPKYIFGHLRVGQLKKKIKDYKGAAEAFQKAIETDPGYPPSYREMADMYSLAGEYQKAKEKMAKYLEMVGNDVSARIKNVIVLYQCKEYQPSIDQGRTVLKDSTAIIVWRIMAFDFVELNQPDSALRYIDLFMKSAKESYILPEDYICYARIYEARKDYTQAVNYYEKAMIRAVEKENPRPELGWTIVELFGNAKMYAEQAVAAENYLKGKTPKLKELFTLGKAYFSDSNYVEADSAFLKMTVMRSDIHLGFLWRGRCNASMDPGNKEGKAKPYYEKVIEILSKSEDEKVKNKRDFIEANGYLGSYYLLELKDCAASRPFWEAIQALDPENKGATDALNYCKDK